MYSCFCFKKIDRYAFLRRAASNQRGPVSLSWVLLFGNVEVTWLASFVMSLAVPFFSWTLDVESQAKVHDGGAWPSCSRVCCGHGLCCFSVRLPPRRWGGLWKRG